MVGVLVVDAQCGKSAVSDLCHAKTYALTLSVNSTLRLNGRMKRKEERVFE